MRLLKRDDKGEFVFTPVLHDPPPYAILSHTWSTIPNSEVTYQDFLDGSAKRKDSLAKKKESFAKIEFIAQRAKEENIEHFWIDNCCIDKRNDAELSTSIRSMYRWYRNAAVCFVYLNDVSVNKRDHDGRHTWDSNLRHCRWFKRGWTLQELIAPVRVEFYAGEQYLGSRASLCDKIHDITGIHTGVLQGKSHEEFAIDTRLRWATGRETTIPEDSVYALMGLCNIVMSPKYGEGKDSAQMRLKKKIARYHGDTALSPTLQAEPGNQRPENDQVCQQERRRETLEMFRFDMIDSRKMDITKALRQTCSWILKHPTYLAWRDIEVAKEHSGFFWIKGKPGAGKSVLVKYLDTYISKNVRPQDICLSFYFHARGESLEKSLEGMYRSLFVQLLDAVEELHSVLDKPRQVSANGQFSLQKLSSLLFAAVAKLKNRQLYCFIDALDECKDSDMQQMIGFFRDLCDEATEEGVHLNVCFASRHYPALDIPTELQIVLEEAEEHQEDLSKYVRSQKFSTGSKVQTIPADVQNDILSKANGVFLWVVLVVEILKKEFLGGRIFAVKKRLKETPRDLSTLFKDIVQRDKQNIDEFLLCLKWILYAKRPLALQEFYFAMLAGIEDSSLQRTPDVLDEFMHNFLRNTSKGLAELSKGKSPRAQFIHESVRDFLIEQNGFRYIDPSHDSSPCQIHETLKQCCLRGIDIDLNACLQAMGHVGRTDYIVFEWKPSKRAALREAFPFLDYATQMIFNHADEAAPEIQQIGFIKEFNLLSWHSLANFLQPHDVNRHNPAVNLTYMLAERDCAHLIALCGRNTWVFNGREGARHRTPLIAALATKSYNAARVMLQLDGADDADGIVQEVISKNKGRTAFDIPFYTHNITWAAGHGFTKLATFLLQSASKHDATKLGSLLVDASIRGLTALVLELLEQGAPVDASDELLTTITQYLSTRLTRGFEGTSLQAASTQGHGDVVRLLLDHGANVHKDQDKALVLAVQHGHPDVVKLLIASGADINSGHGGALFTSLHHGNIEIAKIILETDPNLDAEGTVNAFENAIFSGSIATVKLLINHGADVNAQGGTFGSALRAACFEPSSVEIIKLLLEHGANANANCGVKGNALQAACFRASTKIVQLLLEHGANVNAQGGLYDTALTAACRRPHIGIAQLLINHGAEVNATGANYGSALHAAASRSRDMVKLLLEHGADVHAKGGEYGNALQAAATQDTETVKLLLEHGADVHAQGGRFGNALQAAAMHDRETVKLLLEHGADVNATGGVYGSALQAAAVSQQRDILKLLLEHGADVNA